MDVCGSLLGLYSEFMKFILTRPRLSCLCYEGFEFRTLVRECGNAGRVSLTEILITWHHSLSKSCYKPKVGSLMCLGTISK